MATAVSICSNALLLLGGKTINDFNEDNDRARLASNLYPTFRDWLLRSHPWNCAVKRVALAPDQATPAFDYAYQFVLPSDWKRTLQVGQYGSEVDYRHEGRLILSDDNPLYLRYIADVTEANWDGMLVHCAMLMMAAAMAYPITMSAAQSKVQYDLFAAEMRKTKAVDGQDDPAETLGDFRLLSARMTGTRW